MSVLTELDRLAQCDTSDPRYQCARHIYNDLRRNHFVLKGTKDMDAISRIMQCLPSRQTVTPMAMTPELIAIKEAELEIKRAIEKRHSDAVELKKQRFDLDHQRGISFDRCFYECAKQILSDSDMKAITSLTSAMVKTKTKA